MRILVAPDKFKGTFTAAEVAAAVAAGLTDAMPGAVVEQRPMADGGEGTVAALLSVRPGRFVRRRVTGPLPEMKVDAGFALFDDGTAVIESAAASGLSLLPVADCNPMATTTFGTGELVRAAVEAGAAKIILALGGTATVDGGIGCLQATGFTVLMRDGEPTAMTEPLCGRDVGRVLTVKHGRGEITSGIEVVAACDVMIPLADAARMFAAQKGATAAEAVQLDGVLDRFATRADRRAAAETPGAGAAGGLGFAAAAFMGGTLVSGFDLVADAVGLAEKIAAADVVVTGEGRFDRQTRHGKVVAGASGMAGRAGKRCIVIAGSVGGGPDAPDLGGVCRVFQAGGPSAADMRAAARDCGEWLVAMTTR